MSRASELAWAAGFYDGEGCTTMSKGSRSLPDGSRVSYMRMTVAQNDIRPLERFQKAVGMGTITGPVIWANGFSRNPKWIFNTSEGDSLEVLLLLSPYLSEPKKEQAERCLSEIKRRRSLVGFRMRKPKQKALLEAL